MTVVMPCELHEPVTAPALSDGDFAFLRQFVHQHCGIALGEHKRPLLQGRLNMRLKALRLPDFAAYCALLRTAPAPELGELASTISTNVTGFFREPHHYDLLEELLPAWLVAKQASGQRLRLWSAGCSTGEEPYALAMLLAEALVRAGRHLDARILATDLSPRALAAAREGVYRLDRLDGISQARRQRWLLRGSGKQHGYACVHPTLREHLRVLPLNLLHHWPMRGPFDAILCRNVMIYFDQPTKQRLLQRFAELLPVGGYLFLGHSESMLGLSDEFELIGRTVYRKRAS